MKKIIWCLLAIPLVLSAVQDTKKLNEQELNIPNFPGDVKETFVEVDQAKLFCRVMGKGEPLIVVHGGPGLSQDYLLPQLKKLAEHNLVIFYDQRGSGESTGDVDPKFIQMSTFVNDLDAIRKAFGFKQVSLLGHSFGGLLSMQYAIAHPEAMDKLILLSPTPSCSDDHALFAKEWTQRMAPHIEEMHRIEASQAFKEGDSSTVAKFFRIMFGPYCFDAKKAENLNLTMSPRSNLNGSKVYGILAQNFFSQPFNLQSGLQMLKCKTLIIHGDVDAIPLSTAQNTHKNISQSKFVVMKNCGHFPYVEKPEEFFDHLQAFLKPSQEIKQDR